MTTTTEATPLEVSIDLGGARPSVLVSGQLDYSNVGDVVSALDRLFEEHEACVALDLGEVGSIQLEALRDLAETADAFGRTQRRLNLRPASPRIQTLLDKLPLSDIFCTRRKCLGDECPARSGAPVERHECDIFTLPSELISCREARKRVDRIAHAVGFSECTRQEIMIAVGEASANAVKHGGCGRAESDFTVACVATPEKLWVSVSDRGSGFSADNIPLQDAPLSEESGRGIRCIQAVMDDVSFTFDGGTTVRMVKLGG